jgi:hypothetical protein
MTTPARPPLIRGATMPAYMPRGSESMSAHQGTTQALPGLAPIPSAGSMSELHYFDAQEPTTSGGRLTTQLVQKAARLFAEY